MRKLHESVFLKLLLVFTLAGAANIFVIDTFKRNILYTSSTRLHRFQNRVEYGRLLIQELGTPPSEEKVQELSKRLHLQIRIQGRGTTLVSSPSVPEFEKINAKLSEKYSDEKAHTKLGRFQDYLAVIVQTQGRDYLFLLDSENALEGHSEVIFSLTSLVLLILLLTYLSIRSILSPIKSLEKAVQEVSIGNLNVNIPLESRDELGRLVESFNRMTEQVRTMVRSKEQLLLDVSHEFRSPLTRIKVALEVPGTEARDSIKRSVRELETMITELLESARLDDPQGKLRLSEINLSSLLYDLSLKYGDEKPGIRIISLPQALVGEFDPPRIRTALKNILENALKYSSHQERPVEMTVERPMHLVDQNLIQITIRDFGVGIPEEDQPLIFENFYRVDRSRLKTTGGYGLGLSLSKKIITAHHGKIAIQSRLGKETVFTILLPLTAETEEISSRIAPLS